MYCLFNGRPPIIVTCDTKNVFYSKTFTFLGALVRSDFTSYDHRTHTLSDADLETCTSASAVSSELRYLKLKFAWPAMPRSNLNFSTEVYGRQGLVCSKLEIYVPFADTESQLLKQTFGGSYRKCSLGGDTTTSSNRRCDFECGCLTTICQALYVFLPSSEVELCEVMFP